MLDVEVRQNCLPINKWNISRQSAISAAIRHLISLAAIPVLGVILTLAADARSRNPRTESRTTLVRRSEAPRSRSARGLARDTGRCQSCARAATGRIARSSAARRAFRAEHPCPATGATTGSCPGYVIDHVIALKRGGPDEPANMQWQTKAEARAKDRIE